MILFKTFEEQFYVNLISLLPKVNPCISSSLFPFPNTYMGTIMPIILAIQLQKGISDDLLCITSAMNRGNFVNPDEIFICVVTLGVVARARVCGGVEHRSTQVVRYLSRSSCSAELIILSFVVGHRSYLLPSSLH